MSELREREMVRFGTRIAREFALTYGSHDVYELCALLGIFVLETQLRRLVGFIDIDKSGAFITINSRLPLLIKRFVIAHELGHYVMHPHDVGFFWIMKNTHFDLDRLEKHADDFACELLGISVYDYGEIKEYIRGYERKLTKANV